jgi:hypothetical protein
MLRKYVYSAPITLNPSEIRGFPVRLLQYLQTELQKIALAQAGTVESVENQDIDGGSASSVYTVDEVIDGGSA